MRDLFFTIVAVYVVWKIWSEISSQRNKRNNPKHSNHHHPNGTSKPNDDEYIDYEEVK
jgi:hypothetical protein